MVLPAGACLALASMAMLPLAPAVRDSFVTDNFLVEFHDQDQGEAVVTPRGMVVFDFDNTLSVEHVFKGLAGQKASKGETVMEVDEFDVASSSMTETEAKKFFRTTELGQMLYIAQLDDKSRRGDFATRALGGDERVGQLRELLQFLKGRDIELVIITRGYVGVVNKCLSDVGLKDFFGDRVYGSLNTEYIWGEFKIYEKKVNEAPDELKELLGTDDQEGDYGLKAHKIDKLMKERGLNEKQVMFVDDDETEIKNAEQYCGTHFVAKRAGIQAPDFAALRAWCDPSSSDQEVSEAAPPNSESATGFGPEDQKALRDMNFSDPALKAAFDHDCESVQEAVDFLTSTHPVTGYKQFEEAEIKHLIAEGFDQREVRRHWLDREDFSSFEDAVAALRGEEVVRKKVAAPHKPSDASPRHGPSTEGEGTKAVVAAPLGPTDSDKDEDLEGWIVVDKDERKQRKRELEELIAGDSWEKLNQAMLDYQKSSHKYLTDSDIKRANNRLQQLLQEYRSAPRERGVKDDKK